MDSENLKYAQDLIKASSQVVSSGFNMFVMGHNYPTRSEYYDEFSARSYGYDLAEAMAEKGKIAFTHLFKCRCGGHPFQYGGFWVCNNCGGKDVNEDWWNIKVEKDGNEFCCHGLDFINLQESDNYAFGKTFNGAIKNYSKVITKLKKLFEDPPG